MVRLLCLLIRQRLQRAREEGTEPVAHVRWPAIALGTGALASSTSKAPGAAIPAGAEHAPQTAHLTSINSAFEPAFQVVSGAARVEIGNADPIAHITHVFDGRRTLFNVAMPLQGVPVTRVLGRAGLFEVRCDLHPWMRAAVFVPSNAHHAVIREPGEYRLNGIAPGSYRVIVWLPGHAKKTHAVELAPGAMQPLALAAD